MIKIALIDSLTEAFGHPSKCQEPVQGAVVPRNNCFVKINGKDIATIKTADIHFDSHPHDHSVDKGCHQDQAHDVDPDKGSTTISIDGSPVYLTEEAVTTDPVTDGDVDITDSGGNDFVFTES